MNEPCEQPEVLIESNEQVTTLILNRPDKLNAFTVPMHRLLREYLETARTDENCRAILLTGAGRGFCTGQDLNARDPAKLDTAPELGTSLQQYFNPLVRLIRSIEKPIVCAVNGAAAGAGANLALSCDIVLASNEARFIQSFSKVGLIPDAGGTWMLPLLIGEARAKAITMTATPISATQAAEWGMIWNAVAADKLMSVATTLALELARGPTFGLGQTKIAIQMASEQTFDQQLETEASFQQRCGFSPDYTEGVSSFLDKRTARFNGREF